MAIMKSRTLLSIARQAARIASGVTVAVSTTNSRLIPSRPR